MLYDTQLLTRITYNRMLSVNVWAIYLLIKLIIRFSLIVSHIVTLYMSVQDTKEK